LLGDQSCPWSSEEQSRAGKVELVSWGMLGVHSCPRSSGGNRAELIEVSGAGGGCWETRAAPGAGEVSEAGAGCWETNSGDQGRAGRGEWGSWETRAALRAHGTEQSR
jgi:hypothetical protein